MPSTHPEVRQSNENVNFNFLIESNEPVRIHCKFVSQTIWTIRRSCCDIHKRYSSHSYCSNTRNFRSFMLFLKIETRLWFLLKISLVDKSIAKRNLDYSVRRVLLLTDRYSEEFQHRRTSRVCFRVSRREDRTAYYSFDMIFKYRGSNNWK